MNTRPSTYMAGPRVRLADAGDLHVSAVADLFDVRAHVDELLAASPDWSPELQRAVETSTALLNYLITLDDCVIEACAVEVRETLTTLRGGVA